ncbi:Proteasome subunit alpha type-4 [Mycoemilia scoparia]|uniref:Proteasome subunit alpha type-4 n=1 Tax=Mycoemilia scoparia TaxID=417184 RepID=A0A9W8DP27_9FUNG|nr:Proteasome subunit alpha type-4 [Mycoemilia scoparia]
MSRRVRQVENAIEAVNHGSLVLGLKCSDGALLFAEREDQSKLLEQQQEKIYKIDKHIMTGVVGVNSDSNTLVTRSRHQAQGHLKTFNSPIETEKLVNYVAHFKHLYTQYGGMRPYGVSMLIVGYDEATSEFQLFRTDPAGNYDAWRATCIGKSEQVKIGRDILKTSLADGATLDLDQGIRAALKVLSKIKESNIDCADKIELATLKVVNGEPTIKIYTIPEIKEKLVENKDLFKKDDDSSDEDDE